MPFERALEAGIESGEFAPELPAEVVIDRTLALFDGLALQVLLEAPGMSLERMRELLIASLAADLGVGSSGSSSRRDGRGVAAPAPGGRR
jgi:hypothetical protein